MSPLAPDLPPERPDHEDPEGKPRPDADPPSGAFAAGLILLHLTWAAFVAWLLLVVAMNLFFSTKLLAKVVSSSPDSVVMDYRSIRSWWPGRAHVEGLHLRGSDDNLEWTLDLETADARIALFDLPGKFFHATHVQASGAKFRIRRRLPAAYFEGDPRYVAALPPIADRPFPPLAPDPLSPSGLPSSFSRSIRAMMRSCLWSMINTDSNSHSTASRCLPETLR